MTAEHWPGDCGDVIAADPYGIRARILDYVVRAAINMFGDALGWPYEQQRELYQTLVDYDPTLWTIPSDPLTPETGVLPETWTDNERPPTCSCIPGPAEWATRSPRSTSRSRGK